MTPLPPDLPPSGTPPALRFERPFERGPMPLPPPPGTAEVVLRDYLDVLWRHRWTVLAFLVVVVASTLLVTLTTVPIFRATTLLEIKADHPNLVAFQDVVQMARVEREFYQTQYDVLRSRTLARRVIDRLDLAGDRTFAPPPEEPGVVASALGFVRGLLTPARPESGAGDEGEAPGHRRLVDHFLGGVSVAPRRNSYLVEVSFESESPALAVRVANTIADEYVEMSLDQRLDAVQKGRKFIERQLGVTKAQLERSEEELQSFARANEILTIDSKENIEYRKLSDLNEAVTRATRDRVGKESRYMEVLESDEAKLSEITSNPVVTELTAELAKREAERARLAQTFTDEYPDIRHISAQIAALRAQIGAEQKELSATLRADYQAAKRQEDLLTEALTTQKRTVGDLNQRAIDYKILKREVDTNRSIYNSLLQRLKEVEVAEGIKASSVYVVDPAEVPRAPARPRPLLNLALAGLVGLLGGVGLAFLREHFDSSVKSADDVERHLRLPTLGVLPQIRLRRTSGAGAELVPELAVAGDPRSVGAEALRTLRASLFLSAAAGPPQRILVTSARPSEGKTCMAANLALVLAQTGRRVVLVDCDLRRPRVHRVFGVEASPGLTGLLTGGADLPSAVRTTPYGLDVIPSGPVPPNPVELVDSRSMADFLDELDRRYDFVLLDAPPALGFADVPLLARFCGGVLLVVRAGETPRKQASQAAEYLQRLRARILGVVLNGVDATSSGYYGGYYHYYSSYAAEPLLDGDGPRAASPSPRA